MESVDLVRAAQAGDRRAYDRLFERFYRRVLEVVRARLGPGLRESLESGDVAHDAMVQAIRSFDRFEIRDADGLVRWFARIVENRILAAVDFHRAARRDRGREVLLRRSVDTDLGSGAIDPPDEGPSPPTSVERAEQVGRLRACLEDLDERSRSLLRMRSEAMPWATIAEHLGVPSADAARMMYARLLVRLKRVMEPGG